VKGGGKVEGYRCGLPAGQGEILGETTQMILRVTQAPGHEG
jgi:hypothetical protein